MRATIAMAGAVRSVTARPGRVVRLGWAGLLVLACSGPAVSGQGLVDNTPVSVQVKSPQEDEKGLGRVLTAVVGGNTLDTAVSVERAMAAPRWIRIVSANPEALVYIDRRGRTETHSTDDKGNVTVTHTYLIQGLVEVAGARTPLTVQGQVFDTPGAFRDDPAKFNELSGQLASQAIGVIAARLDVLRPNRAQSGFTFKPKYKFGVKGDGLEVLSVAPGGPADQAGLRVKDRIRSIDGEKGTNEMTYLAQSWWVDGPGRRYPIEYERDKRRQVVELTLADPSGRAAGSAVQAPQVAPVAAPMAGAATRSQAPPAAPNSSNVELKVGMSEADLVRGMGQPQKKISFGPKSVWTYDGFTVTLVNARVADIK